MIDLLIVGAGPSGIACAIETKRNYPNKNILVVDRMKEIGKKIKATGNGKCNIGNENLNGNMYNNVEFVNEVIKQFPLVDYKKFLSSLGIIVKNDSEGRLYPYSESSNQVVELLSNSLKRLNINVSLGDDITKVEKVNNCYKVYGKNIYEAKKIVFATGGASYPSLGSNGLIIKEFEKFQIKYNKFLPSLTSLKADVLGLEGVRAKGLVKLIVNNKIVHSESGEIQFKKGGISGIVIMNISSVMNHNFIKKATLSVDFLYQYKFSELEVIVNNIINNMKEAYVDELFIGLLNKELYKSCLVQSLVNYKSRKVKELSKEEIRSIIRSIKDYKINVNGLYDFENIQVSSGGILLNEINNDFSLKKANNLYAIGELLDIDGYCGGYNLYFAFASGYLVGKNIKL